MRRALGENAAHPGEVAAATALFLGVDGGGTHTRALVADAGGGILGRGRAGPSNQATGGAPNANASLREAIEAALVAAGVKPRSLAAACWGLAGLDRPQDEDAFRPAAGALDGCPLVMVNDGVIAWAGATGARPGVAVIAGTGSVAYGRGPDGRSCRAGGWGGPAGDEGSAWRIAAEAINRALRGLDGRAPPTPLADALAAAAGCAEPADLCLLPRRAGTDGSTPEAVLAALAPVVTAAAAAGQPDALAIVAAAGAALADLAVAVAVRLGVSRPAVHALGGVLLDGGPVFDALDGQVRRRLGVGVAPPRHGAMVGALALAYERALGAPPSAEVLGRWGAEA